MIITDLSPKEFDNYFQRYIDRVTNDNDLLTTLVKGKNKTIDFFTSIPDTRLEYRYAMDKWTIKEVLQHIIDTERIFAYRAFRIARNDKLPLAGFDQNEYIIPSRANKKRISNLIKEFSVTRDFTISILESLTNKDLNCIGVSSNKPLSSRAAFFIIVGHELWHNTIIKERYL